MVGGCRTRGSAAPNGGVDRSVESYGPERGQEGEWFLPSDGDRLRVVVLVHGGFWRPGYDRHLEDDVALLLAGEGLAVWNVDYASADTPWPSTFRDAAAAMDHLAESRHRARLDLDRVAVVGHSAGGHLALWLAARAELPDGAVGAGPRVRARVAVAQAPVADLVTAAREEVGAGAVLDLMDGGPDDQPGRYAICSPRALLPLRDVRITLVHGDADEVVPPRQSTSYADAARALGMEVGLQLLEGVGHFEHLEPGGDAVAAMLAALREV